MIIIRINDIVSIKNICDTIKQEALFLYKPRPTPTPLARTLPHEHVTATSRRALAALCHRRRVLGVAAGPLRPRLCGAPGLRPARLVLCAAPARPRQRRGARAVWRQVAAGDNEAEIDSRDTRTNPPYTGPNHKNKGPQAQPHRHGHHHYPHTNADFAPDAPDAPSRRADQPPGAAGRKRNVSIHPDRPGRRGAGAWRGVAEPAAQRVLSARPGRDRADLH